MSKGRTGIWIGGWGMNRARPEIWTDDWWMSRGGEMLHFKQGSLADQYRWVG